MGWTYLEPLSTTVVGTPAPTNQVFTVFNSSPSGKKFVAGPATLAGNECQVVSVSGNIVTTNPLPFTPQTGDELVQTILGDKDKVRLLTGDTDSTDPQLMDEEISYFLALSPNLIRAAARGCDAIAATLSRKADYVIYQEIQERMSQASKAYADRADRLRIEATKLYAMPFVGGLLQSDKDMAIQDVTHVQPFFTRLMLTEPGTEPGEDLASVGFIQPYY